MTDGAGTLMARYDYDPYGQRAKLAGAEDVDFGYTGHYDHAPSGLNLTLYRAYNPAFGRWLSRDPIGESEGPNLYAYVSNSPVAHRDLLGLSKCDTAYNECVSACMNRRAPYPYECSDYTPEQNRAARYRYCEERCQKAYMRCLAREESEQRNPYTTLDYVLTRVPGTDAQWRVGGDVLLGTGVVLTGAAVVIMSGGSVLVLVPAL
jgi:RHS repeat-associated protein